MASFSQAMDTIAAIATPPGRGGVAIIRISGPQVPVVTKTLLGTLPAPRIAHYLPFKDAGQNSIDVGIAIFFTAPHSFTGEDVLELHGHGGPVVMDMLLKRVYDLGVRPARPGEFSERAFLNNKMDLAQAEAIADLIDAASEQAARSALRSLQGEFSQRIHNLIEKLTTLRSYVEAAIDFPEEEIDFLQNPQIQEMLQEIIEEIQKTLYQARQGQLIREGMTVVIAGHPNAGKSTLLNQLTGMDTAIVTDVPGTTRDVLRAHIQIDGMPIHIIDTAGLREPADIVEQEGIRRAWKEISQADRLLYVVDSALGISLQQDGMFQKLQQAGPQITVVYNKIDLLLDGDPNKSEFNPFLKVSAQNGTGIYELREHLKECVGFSTDGEGGFMARRRHLEALHRALENVISGQHQLAQHAAGELLAEELRQAQQHLSQITGEFTADDLLGKIFSSFCIGK